MLQLLVESSLQFAVLIPQGQGKVPGSKALRRTTLPAPNLVLTLAVLGATSRGLTVIQRGPLVLQLLVESSLRFAKLNSEAFDLYCGK